MDNFEKAVKASKELSSHEGDGHCVINHHTEYLKGSLYIIGFKSSEGKEFKNFVYIEGDEVTVCKNPAILNEFVARKSQKSDFRNTIEALGGVAGIIGLIITITIVWLVINNPDAKIPQILSAALTSILGFYFGSKAGK